MHFRGFVVCAIAMRPIMLVISIVSVNNMRSRCELKDSEDIKEASTSNGLSHPESGDVREDVHTARYAIIPEHLERLCISCDRGLKRSIIRTYSTNVRAHY